MGSSSGVFHHQIHFRLLQTSLSQSTLLSPFPYSLKFATLPSCPRMCMLVISLFLFVLLTMPNLGIVCRKFQVTVCPWTWFCAGWSVGRVTAWPFPPPRAQFSMFNKSHFLTTCVHGARMQAWARCFCNFYVASVPRSESANKALLQIAVGREAAGSGACFWLLPQSWVIIHNVNSLSVPSMYIINGKDYPRKFGSHK